MIFEGIRSERQLMETVHLHLAHRWYIGSDLGEPVPDHGSLTNIRDRYGLATFQRFFEHVVEVCVQAGLDWGKERYFDGTKVPANADIDTLVPRFAFEAKQHLRVLSAHGTAGHQEDATEPATEPELPVDGVAPPPPPPPSPTASPTTPSSPTAPPDRFLATYGGTRLSGPRTSTCERTTDLRISRTDPDATPMRHSVSEAAVLGTRSTTSSMAARRVSFWPRG